MEINTIYYLIYKCFLENSSLETSYDRTHYFCSILGNPKPTKNAIAKLYRILLNRIKIFYHTLWKNEPFGLDPAENGKFCIEIDESKIIGNSNMIIWMFGLIDRFNKDTRIFCILSNRAK